MPFTFISLFAGIGGLDLGLERAGMTCAAQVEIDDYATRVLAKHWPDVPRFRDVREVGAHNLPTVDLIAGGFPCQDLSYAGKGAGIEGKRSGLWGEFARLIGELRPRYALMENVPALRTRGLGRVLADLAAIGYDAEWECIPAAAVGAPHVRDRAFIAAYATGGGFLRQAVIQSECPQNSDAWRTTNGQTFVDYSGRSRRSIPVGLRMDNGLSSRLERCKGLGNAVVPQVAEYVGRCILDHAAAQPLERAA